MIKIVFGSKGKAESGLKMGKVKTARKRANKKEQRARLKLEADTREASISALQKKLKKATEEIKVTKW